MTSKTHLAFGYATTLILTRPDRLSELITCMGAVAIGSVISDIDATTSDSKKNLKKVISITITGFIAIVIGDLFFDTGILTFFKSNEHIMKMLTGFLALIGVCIFGEHQPHRSFMHSIPGVIAVTLCCHMIYPISAVYIAVSMLSHIIIDTLNKKKVRIFYPLKKPSIGFGLCYADGAANKFIFKISSVIASITFIILAGSMTGELLKKLI